MNNKFDELAENLAQSETRRQVLKKFGVGLACMTLACFGLVGLAQAQTSVVCDPAGDALYGSGKGGPAVPPWLDIIQSEITADTSDNILFTLTVAAPIPVAPAWSKVDDGGQLWWGWAFVGDLATDTFVKSGCPFSEGQAAPAAYFVHLIWDVSTSSFHARLLDDTSCVQSDIPFHFSPDRTQFTLVVSKSLLINTVLIPNPNTFQYFAATSVWMTGSTGNRSENDLDFAPNKSNGNLAVVTWSSSSNTSHFCP
jgi:hypothetical protein